MSDHTSSSSPNTNRKEQEMGDNDGSFVYTKRTVDGVKLNKKQYSIKETCQILQLSQVWVRRQIKQRKLQAKLIDGKWMVTKEAILEKLSKLEEKDDRLERRMRGESTDSYQVPSLKSCDIIARRVREDSELSKEQKQLFLARIESYRGFFTERLATIRADRS